MAQLIHNDYANRLGRRRVHAWAVPTSRLEAGAPSTSEGAGDRPQWLSALARPNGGQAESASGLRGAIGPIIRNMGSKW